VLDVASGGGYMTRLLSAMVGPAGHVTAQDPPDLVDQIAPERARLLADRANVSASTAAFDALEGAPGSYDLVVISLFYHDLAIMGVRGAVT
jgi:predicted methyltransferase